jgi:hypothetical protein
MIEPSRITTTRSAISETTPKSWVMNSTPVFSWPCNSLTSFRICARVVTSSAVVGSSAISNAGSSTSAAAIMMLALAARLMRIGVDHLLGIRQMHRAHDLQHALAALGRVEVGVNLQHFADLSPTRSTGLSAVIGYWKTGHPCRARS